jgi:hypothetical protein
LELDERRFWFQQEGAMAHRVNSTMQTLSEIFDGPSNLEFLSVRISEKELVKNKEHIRE